MMQMARDLCILFTYDTNYDRVLVWMAWMARFMAMEFMELKSSNIPSSSPSYYTLSRDKNSCKQAR